MIPKRLTYLFVLFSLFIFASCGGDGGTGGSGGSSGSDNENTNEFPVPDGDPEEEPTDCLTNTQIQNINIFFNNAIEASGGTYTGDLVVSPTEESETAAFDGSGETQIEKKEEESAWHIKGDFKEDGNTTRKPELNLKIKNGCLYSQGFVAQTVNVSVRIIQIVIVADDDVQVEETYTLSPIGDLTIVQVIFKEGRELFRNLFDLFVD